VISPALWISIPYADPDAFLDFGRMHDLQHRELARVTQTRWVPLDDLREHLGPHAKMHDAVARALGLPQVDDLESFDLEDENSYMAWMELNSRDHQRLNAAAGVK